MGLTDSGLLVVLSVLAVTLFVLVVISWPPWRRGVRALGRVLQVLLLNAVVLALALAILNDQYVFYASWTDLFGARSPQVQTRFGGTVKEALTAPVRGRGLSMVPSGPTDYALPQPGSRLQTYSVLDPSAGVHVPVLVYLPVGYDPHLDRRYPVILGLHGFPGAPSSFVHSNFLASADRLTADGVLAPSIFVVPQIDVPAEVDTECVNGPVGSPQADTWLADVVPAWVVNHLRVRTDRISWATFGYSYGAWCSAVLSMRNPDVFGAAVVIEGYFKPEFEPGYEPFTSSQLRAYDLTRMAADHPPPIAMWIFASRQDRSSYPTAAAFLEAARPPLSVHAVILARGGHRPAVFEPHSSAALSWLADTLPGFHP